MGKSTIWAEGAHTSKPPVGKVHISPTLPTLPTLHLSHASFLAGGRCKQLVGA